MSRLTVALTPVADGLSAAPAINGSPIVLPLSSSAIPARTLLAEPEWPRLQALDALWGLGILRTAPGGLLLPWDQLDRLDSPERQALGIPVAGGHDIRLKTVGSIVTPRFYVAATLISPDFPGNLLDWGTRHGPLLVTSRDTWVLFDDATRRLLDLLSTPPDSALEERMAYVAEIQQLARQTGARLDAYLTRESYTLIDEVVIQPEVASPEDIHLVPAYTHPAVGPDVLRDLASTGSRYRETRQGLTRQRIVVKASAYRRLDTLRRTAPAIKGAAVPQFLQNPVPFLPTEWTSIDLADFGSRVKGLTLPLYRAQPFVHVHPQGRGWFALRTGVKLLDDEDTETGTLSYPEIVELVGQSRAAGSRYVFSHGRWIEVPPISDDVLEALKGAASPPPAPLTQLLPVLEVFSNVAEVDYNEPLVGIMDRLREASAPDLPAHFAATLYPYQHDAFVWLYQRFHLNLGTLLADEMGLGKTVEVLAFLCALAHEGRLAPSLIVSPAALVEQWQAELSRFCPTIRHTAYQGQTARALADFDIVLASYDTVTRHQLVVAAVDWQVVVADEAQWIKNSTAGRTHALKALKNRGRIALTGTPVENSVTDLWSMIDFVQPGLLGSLKDFRARYDHGPGEPDFAPLMAAIRPIYMRRTKAEAHIALPAKHVREYAVPLGEEQILRYRDIVAAVHARSLDPLTGINRLREIAGHPLALDPAPDWHAIDPARIPKLATTLDILQHIADRGEKVLIFTPSRALQAMLRHWIAERWDIWATIIHGSTGNRHALAETFNRQTGFRVLILSPKAAGVGLTITSANHVLHYTRWWNPAVENQATDRVHRIGQTRPVTVHLPIATDPGRTVTAHGTVEEITARILAEKQSLAASVIMPSGALDIEAEVMRHTF